MIRHAFSILAIVLLPLLASANSYSYTNVITKLSPSAHPLTFEQRYVGGYRLALKKATGSPYDVTDYDLVWVIEDTRSGIVKGSIPVTKEPGTNGLIYVTESFYDYQPGGYYRGEIRAYIAGTSNYQQKVSDDFITVVESCSDCSSSGGGSGDISITFTSDVTLIESGSGNVITGGVANGSQVTLQRGEVIGGGGAEGAITNVIGMYPLTSTNDGTGQAYVGLTLNTSIIIPPAVATNLIYIAYIGQTSQTLVVGAGITQMYFKAWGGAGGGGGRSPGYGGGGGFTYAQVPVVAGEVLMIEVGQGGYANNYTGGGSLSTNNIYPAGGAGFPGTATWTGAGDGGGRSAVWRGTNIILIAGGGGGAVDSNQGGAGGGTLGLDGNGDYIGYGGSQTEGGVTNGAYLAGGDAVKQSATADMGGGGGDGYYGGGGANNTYAKAAGGGGSGYFNPELCSFGVTISGAGQYPPNMTDDHYISGVGVGEFNFSTFSGHGLVVVLW